MKAFRAVWKWLRRPDEVAVVARGAGRSVVAQGVGVALGFAVHVLLARWLGASEYGAYMYVLTWAALLAALASAGLPTLLQRFVPEYTVQREWALLRGLLAWSSRVTLGAATSLALAGAFLMLLGREELFGAYERAFLAGIWIVPLQALVNLVSGAYVGLHQVGRAHSLIALRHGAVLLGAVLVWWWSDALRSQAALGITFFALLFVLLLQVRPVGRAMPEAVRKPSPDYAPRAWLRVALPLLFVSGFIFLLNQTDLLMVGSLLGPHEAGLYRAASKTAGLIGVIYAAAVAAAGPMIVRLYTEGAHSRLQRLISMVTHGIFWPTLLLVLGLCVAGGLLLRVFGPEYPAAHWVLIVLALGHLGSAATGLGATMLNLTGHQDWGASIFGWSALLNVALNAAGVLLLGLVGAAIATALTMTLQGVAFYLIAHRHLHLDASIGYAIRHSLRKRA